LQPSCDIDECKLFCEIILNNIKRIVIKNHDESIYKFYWTSHNKDQVYYNEEFPDNEKYTFLKPWFLDKAEEYRKRFQ